MYSLRSNLKIFTETHAFAYGTNYKSHVTALSQPVAYLDMSEVVSDTALDNREKIIS